MSPAQLIARLGMQAHPERASNELAVVALPADSDGACGG